MNQKFIEELKQAAGERQVLTKEPMKKHTTFRIGGEADYFIMPQTKEALGAVVDLCKKATVPWHIIGNGSNLLVGDKGVRGAVIQLFKNFSAICVEGNVLTAQAGAINSLVAKQALDHGLTGFEFASGIPGTIGGAVVMNAGAYGGEMKDVLLEATVLTAEGDFITLPKEAMKLGYRTSIVAEQKYIVVEVKLQLQPGDPKEISARMEELKVRRVTKQPLEFPSAGSTFKRPEGYFAGKLIMDAGLRGFTVGGAQVSEKHCGFVINANEATAADVVSLMEQVCQKVYEKFGVRLEPEVKKLGEFE